MNTINEPLRLVERAKDSLETPSGSGVRSNCPPPPADVKESGLPFPFLVDLALKTLFNAGQLRLWQLSERIRLDLNILEPLLHFMRSERFCEVARRGSADADISYQLTELGRQRAEAALRKSQYAGPAPVSLEAYTAQIERQRITDLCITQAMVSAAFEGVVLGQTLKDQFGAALNSGHAMFIHGPSGSGKTYIAEHLVNALSGSVHVPHAILVDDEVIQVFDPLVHIPNPQEERPGGLVRWRGEDRRWELCRRPVVITGGELTLAMLDLQFDTHT